MLIASRQVATRVGWGALCWWPSCLARAEAARRQRLRRERLHRPRRRRTQHNRRHQMLSLGGRRGRERLWQQVDQWHNNITIAAMTKITTLPSPSASAFTAVSLLQAYTVTYIRRYDAITVYPPAMCHSPPLVHSAPTASESRNHALTLSFLRSR